MTAKRKTVVLEHDDLIKSLIAVRKRIDRTQVVAAFVGSLRSKRLELRSPLGSYAYHLNHPPHKLEPDTTSMDGIQSKEMQCRRCSFFNNKGRRDARVDFGYHAELRSKSTLGENFSSPRFAFADLTLFTDAEVPKATDEDWDVLRQLLDRVRQLPAKARLGDLNKALIGLFKGDKYARQHVLEILGFCGVLQPKNRPLVTDRFFCDDPDQRLHSLDWAYPVASWTVADGVNDAGVAFWFPQLGSRPAVR